MPIQEKTYSLQPYACLLYTVKPQIQKFHSLKCFSAAFLPLLPLALNPKP